MAVVLIVNRPDAPSRGHDLKPVYGRSAIVSPAGDAPSRGHDLKQDRRLRHAGAAADAPSRGHDLKHKILLGKADGLQDAPSRGHDLKHLYREAEGKVAGCPLTGHDLKHSRSRDRQTSANQMSPHGGMT